MSIRLPGFLVAICGYFAFAPHCLAQIQMDFEWGGLVIRATPTDPACNCAGGEPAYVALAVPYPDYVEFTGTCTTGWCNWTMGFTPEDINIQGWYISIPVGKCLSYIDYTFVGPPAPQSCTESYQCPDDVWFVTGVQNVVPTFENCD